MAMLQEGNALAYQAEFVVSIMAECTIQIVTGIEVIIGNCFPEVGEILPKAEAVFPQ